jgi:hypothetical protein
MWALSFTIFIALKWLTWWTARNRISHTPARSLAYLFAWPGMDAESFLDLNRRPKQPQLQEWLWAATKTLTGVVLLWVIARKVPADQSLLRGWIGLLGLILLLHFGSFHLISLFWRSTGIEAEPIMAKPILSKTLAEFWGKRWNLGFRQLAHEFIFRPLQKCTGATIASLLVFLTSGLIHDLVISVPAHGGYGLPTAYFVLQGIAIAFERSPLSRRIGMQKPIPARIFTIVITAIPTFWLFHPPFVHRVIIPFMQKIGAL